jgi:hypothetical protein
MSLTRTRNRATDTLAPSVRQVEQTLRPFLRSLAYPDETGVALPTAQIPALAAWLMAQGIGPLAYRRYQTAWPELAAALASDYYSALAEQSVHSHTLERVETALQGAGIPYSLLKGAALSRSAYSHPAERVMSDVDVWVQEQHMDDACRVIHDLGYQPAGKDSRPLALQRLSLGEIQFTGAEGTLVELHWSPFAGWWLQRTAAIDQAALWSRLDSLGSRDACQLAPEDTVLHLAVHLGVNHQFAMYPLRSLLDIALTAQTRPVNWAVVAERARQWRVATVTWRTLALLQALIGAEGADRTVAALEPGPLRRRLLARLVSPGRLLALRDPRGSRSRYLLLLLLVDRPRDVIRLIFRTLWPEQAWMAARYGGKTGRRQHLWNVLRHGRI